MAADDDERELLLAAFALANRREGFRLVHYSIQSNHLHLVCEASGRRELARSIQGLAIRIARGLNRLWKRAGQLFADRYHDHVLRTPHEVCNALAYVLENARKHGLWTLKDQPDRFASSFARAKTWLLTVGWRRHARGAAP